MDEIYIKKCCTCKNDFSIEKMKFYICFKCGTYTCDKCTITTYYKSLTDKKQNDTIHNLCITCDSKDRINRERSIKRFRLYRNEDKIGISGTGLIADGVQFANGKVCVHWFGETQSIVVWDNIKDMEKVNCHNGSTRIIFLD